MSFRNDSRAAGDCVVALCALRSLWRTRCFVALLLGATPIEAQSSATDLRELGADVETVTVEPLRVFAPAGGARAGWNRLYAATMGDDGAVVVVRLSTPGVAVTLFAANGRERWTRRFPSATINGITLVGDTIAVSEQGEHPALVLLSKANGMERARYAMPIAEDEVATVLGLWEGQWYVQRQRSAGLYVAREHYRSVDRFDVQRGQWDRVLTFIDSSPRVYLENGRDAVPPPFPPLPQFAMSPQYGLLFHSGSQLAIEQVNVVGSRAPWIRLQAIDGPLSDSAWARIVADWRANPPVRMLVPDSIWTRAAQLGRGAIGRSLGAMFTASDGTLLVRRRDADHAASSLPMETTWDLVNPSQNRLRRVLLPSGTTILHFARGGRLLLRRVLADGTVSLSTATLATAHDTVSR